MNLLELPFFSGFTAQELRLLRSLGCMRTDRFPHGALILRAGSRTREMGIVVSGCVHIESSDFWGTHSILSSVEAGGVFAETYALCGEALMVDAVAAKDCEILFLSLLPLLDGDNAAESWHGKLMQRILLLTAQKNLTLSTRIFCTSAKNVRGRLLTYLSGEAARQGRYEFDIPFNRQQLADYLNLDRSALSKELSRMRDEGMLAYRRNHFILYKTENLLQESRSVQQPNGFLLYGLRGKSCAALFYRCNRKSRRLQMQASASYISDAFPLTVVVSLG